MIKNNPAAVTGGRVTGRDTLMNFLSRGNKGKKESEEKHGIERR